ncbi:MAG: deoxyribonuclease IV [Candidatus Uhrbacteria bacterium]|nr:deoxyribonuclease IV [Candidatus Uhrbacteria bacterium]
MHVGAHVSAAGGLFNGPKNAGEIGCETFQFFSRPPQGGNVRNITEEDQKMFRDAMIEHKIKSCYIHGPYITNLASEKASTRGNSIRILREELERGSLLGVKGMMFHPGSAKEVGEEAGVKLVIEGLNKIMHGYKGSCQLLIEISAGAGAVMGDSFEELAAFLDGAERGKEIGICFDTQHAFGSGYDFRTPELLDTMIKKFDKIVGLKKLVASHLNDSKVELGSHKDRHESIGDGLIGKDAIKLFVQHPKLQHLDLLLETPMDEKRAGEVKLLKKWRG